MMNFRRWLLLVGLAGLAITLFAGPALAEGSTPLFGGIGTYLHGFANRGRVIQLCMIVMAVALFIMLKKFDGGSGPGIFRNNSTD